MAMATDRPLARATRTIQALEDVKNAQTYMERNGNSIPRSSRKVGD